jgi:hypothetical protein
MDFNTLRISLWIVFILNVEVIPVADFCKYDTKYLGFMTSDEFIGQLNNSNFIYLQCKSISSEPLSIISLFVFAVQYYRLLKYLQ